MTTIRKGARGDDVKTLQGYLGVAEDGIFGAKTRAALIQWQTAHGLEADGICGPITWAALTGEELPEKPKDYKQYDSRWGTKAYTSSGNKKQTMASSGCGPTAMADIVSTWFDAALTPYDLAKMAVEHGFRTKNDGTSWAFFDWIATQYEFSGYGRVSVSNMDAAIEALGSGALIVASMGKGYWTKGGHFICLWRTDESYVYACDPASGTRTKQLISAFRSECKKMFVFYPPIGWGDKPDEETTATVPAEAITIEPGKIIVTKPVLPGYVPGTGIYDISKWQGKIDWDAAAKSGKIGLVILRAGYGQNTVDTRFERNVKACEDYGIPFAVYWYSYAMTADRALNEAASFYALCAKHKPAFFAMDAEEACLTGTTIDAFATYLRELGAERVALYIANHRFKQYGANLDLADISWMPRYSDLLPVGRPLDLWQYGGDKVPGFNGNIDSNRIPDCGRHTLAYLQGEE